MRVEQTWDSLGMRATASHDLHLDVDVPADALLGGVEGLALLVAQLMPHWLVASYAAVYVGVAQAAVDAAVAHVSARGLDRLPAVRARIGRADAAVAAAGLAVAEAARRVDEAPGDPETNRWVWRAKLLAGKTAMDVAASMLEAGRHVGDPPGAPVGAPLPRRPLRLAATGDLATCAPTGWAWPPWGETRTATEGPGGDGHRGRVGRPVSATCLRGPMPCGRRRHGPARCRRDAGRTTSWDGYFAEHYARTRRRRWPSGSSRNSGAGTRQAVVNPTLEDVSGLVHRAPHGAVPDRGAAARQAGGRARR